MNFPPFWARGKDGYITCWGWSSKNLAEAQQMAEQSARRVANLFRSGQIPFQHGGYYPNRPFREQVLQEIRKGPGEPMAVVTRNSYGCEVLNTARAMFVDIDLPDAKPSTGFLGKLFGSKSADPSATPAPEAEALARVEEWNRAHPEWGWRVYRTRAGLRLLAIHAPIEPASRIALEAFAALGSDPLYQSLCQSQKCYRARLTPKPWRCGVSQKPARWPWLQARDEERFRKWETKYRSAAAQWATCEFVRVIGRPLVHPEVQPIVARHDEATRASSNLKLA